MHNQREKYHATVELLMNFSSTIEKMQIGNKNDWKPVQTGIPLCTESVLHFSNGMLNTNIFLLTSRLTQDCLENLFSTIRFKGPSPLEFKSALKIVTVAQFLFTKDNSNYQVDESEYLAECFKRSCYRSVANEDRQLEDLPSISSSTCATLSNDQLSVLYHVAGYCLHSLDLHYSSSNRTGCWGPCQQ